MRGFSLLETLIVVSVSGIIGVVLISLFIQNNALFRDQSVKTSQNLSANDAYSRISANLRQASAIAVSYNAPPTYTTNDSTLVLQLPAINSSGSIIPEVYDHLIITRDLQNPTLLREIVYPNASSTRPATNQIIAHDLQTLTFYYLDVNQNSVSPTLATSINFVVNLSTTIANQPQQSSVSGQVNLRNN